MKIAILGSGNGGCAAAADWALAGHQVRLFDFEQFDQNIAKINAQQGIHADGDVCGFAKLDYAGHSIQYAMEGADMILAVGPSYSSKSFAEAAAPYVKADQIYITCPGSFGGALITKKVFSAYPEASQVCVGETSTLPYAVRVTEPGAVKVFLKLTGGLFLSTIPSKKVHEVLEKFKMVYPATSAAENVFQTMLQNSNPVIHPAVTLLNAGLIERTHGDFLFYEEGVTPSVGHLIEAVDIERLALAEKLGVKVLSDVKLGVLQGYMTEDSYEYGYASAPGFKGIKAQSQLDYRYLNEDVGYGMVFMAELAKELGMATPMMDSVIHIASAVMKRDYRKEAVRTLSKIGYTVDDVVNERY
ncbi:NAD/NADP octopine/nopaline dehydrogenase family protein [Pseudoflavonifractor phocaeensis]|jgi:opine dehydrogenase|uniref:NAD/NADP-dependent octopine/nopaline dehydrogenase family protein n=1 Tax=Pseudoflavonifractor phocaeensis TaxID=1870988 RepID=UPI0025A49420|nr:NAD/NADP-dependent octopine/nopaline dehydrogenase family protein [Pseudoflavonifractor phocaeensis]MDM8239144.1 NAD/NADP octopine/nopaline dehydrogenase family protein [Pseudoflavonifractor phocaeensis]